MRMSGGLRWMARRWSGVVSPVRMPVRTGGAGAPSAASRCATPASGACKLRSTSAPSALSGDTYSTRTPRGGLAEAGRAFSRMSASSANRNAASVLPEPVGAMTSAFSPSSTASHACSCTGVAPAGNASRNHPRTASENRMRASGDGRAPSSAPAAAACAASSSARFPSSMAARRPLPAIVVRSRPSYRICAAQGALSPRPLRNL